MSDAAPESSRTTLRILNLILRHFAHGMTNMEIAEALKLNKSVVTRHVQALEAEGFAERIPEMQGRIRPSVRMAQAAVSIQKSLADAASRYQELNSRINAN